MDYLDFEEPVKRLAEELQALKEVGKESKVDLSDAYKALEARIEEVKKEIYQNLTSWQRVRLSRHPSRPLTLNYIQYLCGDTFLELFGDRAFKDDKAIVGGLGKIDNQSFMFVGHQKGFDMKTRQYRNFGMANPEGYRKALRLMQMAEKFNIPIVCFIDTPGAHPGSEAEDRGQGEAIARNISKMSRLKVPIILIIIGEGASGGALGIGVGDQLFMLENTWFSVISPESCSTILWKSTAFKEKAAEQLKLAPADLLKLKLIDGIVKEPLGGAHFNPDAACEAVKKTILAAYKKLSRTSANKLVEARMEKYLKIGIYGEG